MSEQVIVRRADETMLTHDLPKSLHPILARIYAARRVRADELDTGLDRLLGYQELKGIETAVALLERALNEGWRILVVGDFDADGATSTALALRALRAMGATEVDYLVPNRFEYGYGLTPEIVAVAVGRQPDLLITVDNGISSLAGVEAARAAGIRVLVTDHHLPGADLPRANAIVNPNQPEDAFPSKHLAGVGVIFYVMLALRARLRERDWFGTHGLPDPNLAALLDLVTLGTVADVVVLDANNRILVAQGLARMRAGRLCPGIQALLETARRPRTHLVASDLGFGVAPRLNAAGRLEDMSLGIACLLADDLAQARALAARLDALNQERRSIEAQMKAQALSLLDAMMDAPVQTTLPVGVCLFEPGWHEGVIGILAARIKERLHRPVIAFAVSGEDGWLKGSARSVPGLHIRDALDAVAARHPGLLSKFGGHAMAAGLSLPMGHFEDFAAAFDAEARRHLQVQDLRGLVLSDGELAAEDFSLDLAETLRYAGPWGQGFAEPLFDGEFQLLSYRIVGQHHLKLRVCHPVTAQVLDAIAFNADDTNWPAQVTRLRMAYRLDVNEYQGIKRIQLRVEYLEPV